MPKMRSLRSKKAGLPPGTLIHIGEKRVEEVKIMVFSYNEERFEEKRLTSIKECLPVKEKDIVTWIDVEGVHQVDVLEKLGDCYRLHPLTLEDISNTNQRPKLEDYEDYLYIVLRILYYDEEKNTIIPEQLSIVLGENYVISFQEGIESDIFDPIRERIKKAGTRLRREGADYLAYSLLDTIVDGYFMVLEQIGEDIELLEDELVENPTPATSKSIQKLKGEMLYLRRSIWPLREVIGSLERREFSLISEATGVYLRDVYDHTIEAIDSIETFRETLSGMVDIYLSSVSNRLNEVVKVLTIISTIFIPLTFIVGVYGMNFRYMPELNERWAYPVVWLVMILVAISMLIYFRKRKWL